MIKRNKSENSILYIPYYIYVFAYNEDYNLLVKLIYDSIKLNHETILVNISTDPNKGGLHWVLGVINLSKNEIIILNSLKIVECLNHFEILFQILQFYHTTRNFFGNQTTQHNNVDISEWHFILAINAVQQTNFYDCGYYVCIHAYCYITKTQFFDLSPEFGREWLYYNHVKYTKSTRKEKYCRNFDDNYESIEQIIIKMCETRTDELRNEIQNRITYDIVNQN